MTKKLTDGANKVCVRQLVPSNESRKAGMNSNLCLGNVVTDAGKEEDCEGKVLQKTTHQTKSDFIKTKERVRAVLLRGNEKL